MKGKALLSSLVTLSLVVSSYGVTMADTVSGTFYSSSDSNSFSWTYDGGGNLSVAVNYFAGQYPKDFGSVSAKVEKMSISSSFAGNTSPYTYSYFKDDMTKLETISVNDNCRLLSIKNTCPYLETININNNSNDYISIDLSGRTSSIIPEVNVNGSTVKYINIIHSQYSGSEKLTVPASYGIGNVFDYSFTASKMKTVIFEKGTQLIRERGFADCDNLTTVSIPYGVTKIEYSAFRNCPKLESITIPASVKSIGMNAFKESGIKTIDYLGTRAQWFGLVKEYDNNEDLVGETLHLDGVVVHCSDGDVLIHYNKNDDPQYYQYYQNYYGWEKVDGKWYYYKANGSLATGEPLLIDNNFYYFNKDGVLQTGWFHISGSLWSYADKSGIIKQKGWLQDGGSWYYFNLYFMQTGWHKVSGVKYYFDKTSGKMVTGWQEIDGKWYLFNSSGAMQTGWKQSGNTWYYLDPSDGSMVTGWKEIDGKWYFLKSNGAMAASEWCGGYWLNADGTWTYPYKATWRKTNNKWWFGDDSGWYAKNETLIIDGVSYKFDAKGYLV